MAEDREISEQEEGGEVRQKDADVKKGKNWRKSLLGKRETAGWLASNLLASRHTPLSCLAVVFPQLTLYRGRELLSQKKSALVIATLYFSHTFSAWASVF